MKPTSSFSAWITAVLSVLLAASHVAAQPDAASVSEAADAILAAYDRESVLLIGELHGTMETPALVGILAERLAAEGSVALGLEIPRQEQQRIDRFMESDGGSRAVADLLAGEFWQRPAQRSDGRRSTATVELLEAIRGARSRGLSIDVVTLDDQGFHLEGSDRRQGMADRIAALADGSAHKTVVALLGNYHASVVPFSGSVISRGERIDPPVPTAAKITGTALSSINVTACSGAHWACYSPEPCGPVDLPGQCTGTELGLSELDASRAGYHFGITLEQLTVSPPAQPEPQ